MVYSTTSSVGTELYLNISDQPHKGLLPEILNADFTLKNLHLSEEIEKFVGCVGCVGCVGSSGRRVVGVTG